MKKTTLTVGTMAIGIFLCMLDTTVMNIALPAMQTGLQTSLSQLSWALNLYTILFASLTIPLGRLADIYGRHRFYILGLALFLMGSLTSGMAASVSWLIAGRGIQSLGAAIVFPASMTIGLEHVSLAKRTSVIAILGTTQGLASALGPTIGGAVTQFWGWRGIFLINVPLVVLALGLCLWLLDWHQPRLRNVKIDWWGSLFSMVTLFSLTLVLVKGSDWGWTSSVILALGGLSIVSLSVFIWTEAHVAQPMMPLDLFKTRQFTGAAVITVIAGIFLVALLVLLPSFFTKVQSHDELTAALMITPTSLMIFIFSPISGLLLTKVGPRLVIASGAVAMVAGYIVISWADPADYWQVLLALLLVGAGYGIMIGPITVLAAGNFTGDLLTASQSVIGVARQIGTSLAVAIFVAALSTNLTTAKTHIWHTAQREVAALTIDRQAKTDTLTAVYRQLQTEQTAMTSGPAISAAKQRRLVQTTTQRVLQQKHLQAAPTAVKKQVAKQVQQQVARTVATDNRQIAQVTAKIKHTTKMALTQAFMRPYRIALPFTISLLLLVGLFDRRRDYLQLTDEHEKNSGTHQ